MSGSRAAVATQEGKGRTALVTGASAGIGAELARVFAAHGFDLVLTARRAGRLTALAKNLQDRHGVRAHVLPADLAQGEACENLVTALQSRGIAIDALVNNAGYGVSGNYNIVAWNVHRDFLQVLVTAPCELTHRLLPGMIARRYGRILNVASVAGFMPGSANHTLYGGAKAMMIKWSQSLHSEMKGTGVFVTALCPGFTLTEFHDVNGTRAAMRHLPKSMWLAADRVALEGYGAVMRNSPLSVPGIRYKAITAFVRLLPMNMAHRLGEARSRVLKDVK
jgi:short-subunit dehydrogenase